MAEEIINKVAQSGILTLDLEGYYPKEEIIGFDIKPLLYMEMLLKEKDFRQQLKTMDWSAYEGKAVAIYCSADAIIPRWAYMLLAVYLQPVTAAIYVGTVEELAMSLLIQKVKELDYTEFEGKRIIIKGCGPLNVSAAAYMEMTKNMLPFAQSIMYGEACSSVPVYKKKKVAK